MTRFTTMLRCLLLAAFVLAAVPLPARAYVEAAMSLGAVVAQSTNIVLMRVEKVDKEKNMIIFRKVRDVKGKHPVDVIKHNIGRGGFHPREWQYPMEWAEVGKTAVFMHNGGASETCIGLNWYQAYAGGEWWNMSHGEPFMLRSFAGKPEKLAAVCDALLQGQETIASCMVDGNKEDLHLRRARMQKLKVSLKLLDYNPKRDFVGWGGAEEFVRLIGMPGFTHLSALPRVDPEAQAVSSLDVDGDGKVDLCLVGGGKVSLLLNGGESMNEQQLPGASGCRAAVWADYNGDGRADLFLATINGPKLYTNLGGTFRDDTTFLPTETCYNLTAAAWMDHDGDGQPDLLLGNGFHGLRLYRNTAPLKQLQQFAADLNHNEPNTREQATLALEKIGPAAEAVLAAAVKANPTPEVQQRATRIQEKWKQPAVAPAPNQPPQPAAAPFLWFEDVSSKVGLGPDGIGASVKGDTLTVADVNGDSRPDFLYGAGNGLLVLNTPQGFAEAKDSGITYKTGKVGPVFGDVDGDGHLDLFVPQHGAGKLFRNDGKGKFTDVTAGSGDLAKALGQATSAAWGDFYNDGRSHLVVGYLRGPNRLFRNLGDGKFRDETDALGLGQRIFNTQAVCLTDLNSDGMLDVVFNNEGQDSAVLLGNKAVTKEDRTPVTVQVAGTGVLGSRVKVLDKDGKERGMQQLTSGDGRGGQSPLLARFALPPGAYKVEVRYSSGVTRTKDVTVAAAPLRSLIDDKAP